MAKQSIQVEVSKETYEVGDALASIVESVKQKAADGLSAPEIAAALSENIGKLMTAMQGIDQLDDEAKEDLGASVMAGAVVGARITSAMLKKQAAPVQA